MSKWILGRYGISSSAEKAFHFRNTFLVLIKFGHKFRRVLYLRIWIFPLPELNSWTFRKKNTIPSNSDRHKLGLVLQDWESLPFSRLPIRLLGSPCFWKLKRLLRKVHLASETCWATGCSLRGCRNVRKGLGWNYELWRLERSQQAHRFVPTFSAH